MNETKKIKRPKLENWRIVNEYIWYKMIGEVYNYPGKAEGQLITTSPLKKIDLVKHEAVCETRVYDLGEPDFGSFFGLIVKKT